MKQENKLDILDILDGVRGNEMLAARAHPAGYKDARSEMSRTEAVRLLEKTGSTEAAEISAVARKLLARANDLRERATDLPPEYLAEIRRAIEAYCPWEREEADHTLLKALTQLGQLIPRLYPVVAAPSQTQSNYDHPFHLLPVRTCLSQMKRIFELPDYDKTSREERTRENIKMWKLSQPAAQLVGKKIFLSHAWADWKADSAGQAKLLRAALQQHSKDAVWIGTSNSPTHAARALLGQPVMHRLTQLRLPRPAADKCCVNQESAETTIAGVESLRKYMESCDYVLCMITPAYLAKLWVVYEIMLFGHRFRGNLDAGFIISIQPGKLSEVADSLMAFRAEELQCVKPADRTKVLEAMRELWGSETNFDEWVREMFAPFVQRVGGGAPTSSACIVA
jgi:hypothetical protein